MIRSKLPDTLWKPYGESMKGRVIIRFRFAKVV